MWWRCSYYSGNPRRHNTQLFFEWNAYQHFKCTKAHGKFLQSTSLTGLIVSVFARSSAARYVRKYVHINCWKSPIKTQISTFVAPFWVAHIYTTICIVATLRAGEFISGTEICCKLADWKWMSYFEVLIMWVTLVDIKHRSPHGGPRFGSPTCHCDRFRSACK